VLAAGFTAMGQKPAVMTSDKAGWHKIATNHVSYKTDRDEVVVLGKDHFKGLTLVAKDAPVDMLAFDVYFEGDKTPQKFELLSDMKVNEESKEFLLEGNQKAISKIVLVYKTIPVMKNEKER